MTFYTWLMRQKKRDDVVGDLALDTARTSDAPRKDSTLKGWHSFLRNQNACTEAQQALTEAFKEYGKWQKNQA